MPDDLVTRKDANGVSELTLNRPEKLNALTPAMFVELRQHIDRISEDSTVGCVILKGNGKSFCAGHDLASITNGEHAPTPGFEAETIDALEKMPQPSIAIIHGYCFTGGLELALGCDILCATESSTLADTHGRWGLAPIWGMSIRLPERVGLSRAKEMMFTSRRLSGNEALNIGLVDHCVSEQSLDETVLTLAGEILRNSRGSNRIYKALLSASTRMTRAEALAHEQTQPFGVAEDMEERMAKPIHG